MTRRDEEAELGLTPREWLDDDPVPLTPDVDLSDPDQRRAWTRANNEEIYQRGLELQARRDRRRGTGGDSDAVAGGPVSTTTVVAVRMLNAEHRALVRQARRENVTVSDLLRRWARAGLEAATGPDVALDAARVAAVDSAVGRIGDDLRRLRELAVRETGPAVG